MLASKRVTLLYKSNRMGIYFKIKRGKHGLDAFISGKTLISGVWKGGEKAAGLQSCLHRISVCPVDASSEPLKSWDP